MVDKTGNDKIYKIILNFIKNLKKSAEIKPADFNPKEIIRHKSEVYAKIVKLNLYGDMRIMFT